MVGSSPLIPAPTRGSLAGHCHAGTVEGNHTIGHDERRCAVPTGNGWDAVTNRAGGIMPSQQQKTREATMRKTTTLGLAVLATLSLQGAANADESGRVLHMRYDGVSNDLLTAGLGKTGLGSAVPPGFVDPLNPTAEELRRSAIYNNYRALVDPTPGGGYGTLYGPNVRPDGTVTTSEGLIAGDEYIAFEKGNDGKRVTMMVQVPDSFDVTNGCIITAPSSGSRGVYGDIATAGDGGLKRCCPGVCNGKESGH